MKAFSERDPMLIGAVGVGLTSVLVVCALNYDKIPGFNRSQEYSAYFADASGLVPQAPVQVSGLKVGQVESLSLADSRVLVTFSVLDHVHLGDRTEAAIKTRTVLGAKMVELVPRGDAELEQTIPLERTRSAYQLPDQLGKLSETISDLNVDDVSKSLDVLSQTFRNSPPALQAAVSGVAQFSEALAKRDDQLRSLLANARKASQVLGDRGDELARLVKDTDALLAELRSRSDSLDTISANISAFSGQLKAFIAENSEPLKPALDKLNGVLAIVENRKNQLQQSIRMLNQYLMSLGEAASSGPYFKAYIANMVPGQLLQPFIDAAFKDLGLDPNVLLPSERADPPVGQPGTPPLPVPFPRTGQAGDPRLSLPDAITGNPGDQACGPPGLALPGPGCYPYSDPGPAPAPGGPPPGPPAPAAPDMDSTPEPTPSPVYQPAPDEVPDPSRGSTP